MRLYKWFHGARCFILKHHMFAIDIIGISNKMIPNVSTARGAVTCGDPLPKLLAKTHSYPFETF